MRSIIFAKISIGGAEFPIDLPNITMVEAMLLATKPIRVNPTVTELDYKLIPSCDACERHAPSVTINAYGENTTHYDIAPKYTPALNTAQTTDTPLDPIPSVCNVYFARNIHFKKYIVLHFFSQ